MNDYLLDDEEIEALSEDKRHKDMMTALGRLIIAIETEKKEESLSEEFQVLLSKNKELISEFISKVKEIEKPEPPKVKINVNQDEIITALNGMTEKIIKSLNSLEEQVRLSMIKKPLKCEFIITDRTSIGFASRVIAKEIV